MISPPPVLVGRPLLGAVAALNAATGRYIHINVAPGHWANKWLITEAEVIEWAEERIELRLKTKSHRYHIRTMLDGTTVVDAVDKQGDLIEEE